MRFEYQGISVWYGTDDAPAPVETVAAGAEVTVTVGVQPANASNKVEVLYRINEGSTQKIDAPWLRSIHASQSQYFRAKFPLLRVGDRLDYAVTCRCAGRQVPSPEEAKQFSASFRVVAAQEMPNATITDLPNGRPPSKLSSSSSSLVGNTAVKDIGGAGEESKPKSTANSSGEATAENNTASPQHEIRFNTLNALLTTHTEQQAVKTQFLAAKGDWAATLVGLKDELPVASLQKVALAHSLADWSSDNVPVVKAVLAAQPDMTNLRDLALRVNVEKLATLVDPKDVPETTPGTTPDEKHRNFAVGLRQKLFVAEPTAVLHRMVQDAEVPIADVSVRSGVTQFLNNQPDFNIRKTSIYTALKHADALKGVANEHQAVVIDHLKTLQRVQAISPVPEAVPVLMNANLNSAFQVAQVPESTFLRAYGGTLGDDTALQVHTNAINNHIRNEHALITMRETMRGTGLAIIDGQRSMPDRIASLQSTADKQSVPLNLETLFGSMDFCECDECLSVYSPAAYFVELLQFLRNNKNPNTGTSGYANTPLEKLFRRRPDLGCLELTCENTFTVLPYIDLVNEVMESFVVYQEAYHSSNSDPNLRKAKLDVFNVEGETTSELLAQPQHINYEAYCILKNAVYPFTLPYHQPIDAIRIFLDYLKTSRYELLDTYRTAKETCTNLTLTEADEKELEALHKTVQDRSVDAEFLGLTQEEYIIVTKEAFWPKRYFEITQGKNFTDDEYRNNIGVRQVCEYYGYVPPEKGTCDSEMCSLNEDVATGRKGLTFVKKQFLPRTGITYTDLVELLKTQFINPYIPQGQALTILNSIRFSYRFLQTLVDGNAKSLSGRFGKLIDFLNSLQPLVPWFEAQLHPDPCHPQKIDVCTETQDFTQWVCCYFEKLGKLIVLESGEGPQLPIEGQVVIYRADADGIIRNKGSDFGILQKDGTIRNKDGSIVANVAIDGKIIAKSGIPLTGLEIRDVNGKEIAHAREQSNRGRLTYSGYSDRKLLKHPVNWLPAKDTCDLDKVRLIHLDGSGLALCEYDRIHRFIRLWRKLNWTIDEIDKALTGLSDNPGKVTATNSCNSVDFSSFTPAHDQHNDMPQCGSSQTIDLSCPNIPKDPRDITPNLIPQLADVKKLLDLTGLPLIKLLAFWAEISTAGEKSLYAQLFLTHNLVAIDSVFQADADGNYLTKSAKIVDHIPVLMAALKLKADDITLIMAFRGLDGFLTLSNVSVIYRHSLLAKLLHVRVTDLVEVITLLVDPFTTADQTLSLLDTWGKMEDAGFTFRQLNYVIRDHDDVLHPLAPSQRKLLQITKTLYDGLNAIDRDNPNVQKKEDATADLVRTKTGLLFEQSVVEQIIGLLEGTSIYITNAPEGLTIQLKETNPLSKKLKYTDKKDAVPAFIQVTGILTDDEKTEAKALSINQKWIDAIDRVGKQPLHTVFNDILFGIFSGKTAEAQIVLLAGDYNNPADPQDIKNTAPAKRFYFLQNFMPFLRERLYQRLIVDTTSSAAGLASDVTKLFLSEILLAGTPAQSAMTVLEKIKDVPPGNPSDFKGYLIPSVDDQYTFVAVADKAPTLTIDGDNAPFPYQQDDPSNVWSSDPVKLKAGKLYWLEVAKDKPDDQLQWKTATLPRMTIPASALLPDYSSERTKDAFVKLYKAAIMVNGFSLSVAEIGYWQGHGADFSIPDSSNTLTPFDFNEIKLGHWQRLQAYTNLRNNLPRTEIALIDLFKWANKPDATKLSDKIAAATTWKTDAIDKLIAPDTSDPNEHFDLDRPEAFRDEVNLVKLHRAIRVADKIGVDIDRLFEWAKPGSKYWECHQIAEDIRKAIRARFSEDDWEQVVQPLNDQLREHQKLALIAYLLVQPDLIDWGVVDADSLFEFFLIDVQMDACMQTSRIKQAICSIQLFIQRCLLRLEEKQVKGTEVGVPGDAIDRDRWEWMQQYRVWEANRKVFCYPENWIEPQLRDDKSPFYEELESELLQKDINKQTVQDALKNYIFKLDEIANLKVIGLFLDEEGSKLHVFSRTRNTPYFYYFRYFHTGEKNWYPWKKMQVDIPNYDAERIVDGNRTEEIVKNGSFLIPVVWNKRLLIFIPQFVKKMVPTKLAPDIDPKEKVPISKPIEAWEIKMGWSEYRNGKWTQKNITTEAIYQPLWEINIFVFIPTIAGNTDPKIIIEAYVNKDAIGSFHFTGSQLTKNEKAKHFNTALTDFSYKSNTMEIHSLQAAPIADSETEIKPPLFTSEPFFKDQITGVLVKIDNKTPELLFYHPFAHQLLGKVASGDLDTLFNYFRENIDPSNPAKLKQDAGEAYGEYGAVGENKLYNELKRACSIYNWEATFHAPMLLVDGLHKSQQFEQALKMCHHVFNPYEKGAGKERVWQFPPFKVVDAESILESLFAGLKPNTPDNTPGEQINEWRDKPFQPHVIARSRPSAYMKWVVTKYIEILIDWGDHLFRQDTIESLNQATQLYILAAHLYGPRGYKIPKRGKITPQSYNSLLDKWDAFGNAMVEMELAAPYSNQSPFPIGITDSVVGLANVFGFATTLYFCIPDNPELRALRDTIDDRLFKIRHCQNIQGVFRQLPLFEPPIDPGLLVQAAAQGLSLATVLSDMNSPIPNYRFYYLLQKALEVCSELKGLSNGFLLAKEKRDTEAISNLRARHESSIQNLVMEIKKKQLDEANQSLDALQQNRKGPLYRLQHQLKLIGEDLAKVPEESTDFSELPNSIEAPIDDGGLKLISLEKEEIDKSAAAADWLTGIGITEALASVFHALPIMHAAGHPLGVGVDVAWGMPNLGHATQGIARSLRVYADHLSHQSVDAGRKASLLRQLQERIQQANVAGYEIKGIDKQILTQKIRIDMALQDINNQQMLIDNAREVEEFLRGKYTNEELYLWMQGQLQALCYQSYTVAYDLANKAEKAFRFERGLKTSNFIQFGYWDPGHDGLLAAERMVGGLQQLEAAYRENRGYDFEVLKHISLRQISPLALVDLKEMGVCEFYVPEVLFDMDRPGDYMRRIKSIAVTVPCVVGPYTSLNCTLRLLEHEYRSSSIVSGKGDYPKKTDETDDRFSTCKIPISAIAVSTGLNDSGVFELNFHDERYIPFEGAGGISKWRLELPDPNVFSQFDYDTITDVVMQMRYTSLDGGDKLKSVASQAILSYIKSIEELSQREGLFALFDLKHEFPNEWYKAMQPPEGVTERVLPLDSLYDRLPIFTKTHKPKNVQATDMYLFTSSNLNPSVFVIKTSGDDISFGPGRGAGTLHSCAAHEQTAGLEKWQLRITDITTPIDKLLLVIRYQLIGK